MSNIADREQSDSTRLLAESVELFSRWSGMHSNLEVGLSRSSANSYVICAVLDDEDKTWVRIGAARYNASSKSYHMIDGSLCISESNRSAVDGLYTDGRDKYSIVTEAQFAEYVDGVNAKQKDTNDSKLSTVPNIHTAVPSTPHAAAKPCEAATRFSPQPWTASPPVCSLEVTDKVKLPGPAALSGGIGCSAGSNSGKTVFAVPGCGGNRAHMRYVVQRTIEVAVEAKGQGNQVSFVFMGDVVSGKHLLAVEDEGKDSLMEAIKIARSGIEYANRVLTSDTDITLVVGPRELAWIRLINESESTREITNYSAHSNVDQALKILLRRTPLHGVRNGAMYPEAWARHDESLRNFEKAKTEDVIAVAMLLKLVSMSKLTMNAPFLVHTIAQQDAANCELLAFLNDHDGTIEGGIQQLFAVSGNGELSLTSKGTSLVYQCITVVQKVLIYGKDYVSEYLTGGKIIHYIEGQSLLWFSCIATNDKQPPPNGTEEKEQDIKQWAYVRNEEFKDLVKNLRTGNGTYDYELFKHYIEMSAAKHPSPLPFDKLLPTSAKDSCSVVCAYASRPFGTIFRQMLLTREGDLIRPLSVVADIMTPANMPSVYYSVATWCSYTKSRLQRSALPFDRTCSLQKQLHSVSAALWTMLCSPIDNNSRLLDYGIEELNGILGPVVNVNALDGANECSRPMRLMYWFHKEITYVVLLEEVTVTHLCSAANYPMQHYTAREPYISIEGILLLPDSAELPIGGSTNGEFVDKRGARVWAIRNDAVEMTSSSLHANHIPLAAVSGAKLDNVPGHTVFTTQQDALDPLSGLHVGIVSMPGHSHVTIGTDTTGDNRLFRIAVSTES